MAKVVGFGNCQAEGIARCAAAALGLEAHFVHPATAKDNPELLAEAFSDASIVFASRELTYPEALECAEASGRSDLIVIPTPNIYFSGFHPDMVFPSSAAGYRDDQPMVNANSAILLAAWREGIELGDAIGLFRDEVYDALGYYGFFGMATDALIEQCLLDGIDIQPRIPEWLEHGPFVYVPNHPRIHMLQDLAMLQLQRHKLHDGNLPVDLAVDDPLSRNLIWPVYPEIADRLGVGGDYIFRPKKRPGMTWSEAAPMDLEAFAERTYACYGRAAPDCSLFVRLTDPRLERLRRFVKARPGGQPANPYKRFNASNWWSKAVAEPAPQDVDPMVRAKFTVGKREKVATAGSCFAQHLAKRLAATGFNYFVSERAPADCTDPVAQDYGVFTARFGNIYTVRQLLQLADRAYGNFQPAVDAWGVEGGYVDPFRPRIGGNPFPTLEALRSARESHFAAVREMFQSADVFVFTLGLTEAWAARADGAVVPLAPGVVGADVANHAYLPKNFTMTETVADLTSLVELFQQRNSRVRILLTVSPVPLIATYEDAHVLEATTYSKSVLRAAAGEIARTYAHVAYFPSFEIVTGSFNRGRYFADDLRQVTDGGVDHVMKVFLRHYGGVDAPTGNFEKSIDTQRFRAETKAGMEIVCDEEVIEGATAQNRTLSVQQ
jgi:hypothetical protein